MLQAIAENAGTIIITLALIGIVTAVVFKLRADRKKGRTSCGGNCCCCPMAGSCHKQSANRSTGAG